MNNNLNMPKGTRLKCKAKYLTTKGVEAGKEYKFIEYDEKHIPINNYAATMTWYPNKPIWTPEEYEVIKAKFMMIRLEGVRESQWLIDFEII